MVKSVERLAALIAKKAAEFNAGKDTLKAGSVFPGVNGMEVLGVNDLSLPTGGQFDVDMDANPRPWQPPHQGHRVGKNADLDIRGKTSACQTSSAACTERQDSIKYQYYFDFVKNAWEEKIGRNGLGDERAELNHVHLRY